MSCDGTMIGLPFAGCEDVVGGHHQNAGFELRFKGQRYVNSHLVAVKVGVESGADQRMKLDCLAFNQHRLKCLDTKTVKRRRTVQQNRMLLNNFFENIPDFRLFLFNQFLGLLDGGRIALPSRCE